MGGIGKYDYSTISTKSSQGATKTFNVQPQVKTAASAASTKDPILSFANNEVKTAATPSDVLMQDVESDGALKKFFHKLGGVFSKHKVDKATLSMIEEIPNADKAKIIASLEQHPELVDNVSASMGNYNAEIQKILGSMEAEHTAMEFNLANPPRSENLGQRALDDEFGSFFRSQALA